MTKGEGSVLSGGNVPTQTPNKSARNPQSLSRNTPKKSVETVRSGPLSAAVSSSPGKRERKNYLLLPKSEEKKLGQTYIRNTLPTSHPQ